MIHYRNLFVFFLLSKIDFRKSRQITNDSLKNTPAPEFSLSVHRVFVSRLLFQRWNYFFVFEVPLKEFNQPLTSYKRFEDLASFRGKFLLSRDHMLANTRTVYITPFSLHSVSVKWFSGFFLNCSLMASLDQNTSVSSFSLHSLSLRSLVRLTVTGTGRVFSSGKYTTSTTYYIFSALQLEQRCRRGARDSGGRGEARCDHAACDVSYTNFRTLSLSAAAVTMQSESITNRNNKM